jgi:hypothetical protein
MAVGFEFQSPSLKVYKISSAQEKKLCDLQSKSDWVGLKRTSEELASAPKCFDKSVVLSRSAVGWCAVPDGDDVEFVVTQIPIESGGATHLAQVMESLTLAVQRMQGVFMQGGRNAACPWVVRSDEPRLFNQYPPFLLKWDLKGQNEVIGFPQITGGVVLSKLRKVLKILAKNTEASDIFLGKEKPPYVTLLGNITKDFRAKSTSDPKWPGHTPSREMRSLVSLIAAYLARGGAGSGQGLGAVKQLWFIMARTDFGTLFKQLPNDEQTHYRQRPGHWVDYICGTVMPAVNAKYTGGMNADGWVIDRKITDYQALKGDDRVQIEITRRQWLVAMTAGQDVLTQAAHPHHWWDRKDLKMFKDVNGEHRLRGSGALGDKMDEIVLGNLGGVAGTGTLNAPIFEFRAPGVGANTMPYTAWPDYALKAYRFLAAANALDKETPIDEAKVFTLG